MGILDGALAQAVYNGFKDKLLKGVLRQTPPAQSGGLDEFGDPTAVDPVEYPCQGFTETYSDFYRASAGIPDTDVRVLLFSKSLPAGVRPGKDSQIKLTQAGVSTWYQVRRVGTDPATAMYACQAFQIQDPT